MLVRNGLKDGQGDPPVLWREIRPEAIAQGQVGNCWLIAAISALAEYPQAVKDLFVEADVQNGRYVIQLYDMSKASWEEVEIDDYIPCVYRRDMSDIPHTVDSNLDRIYQWQDICFQDGSKKPVPCKWIPHFAQPGGGDELWPVLLEKAMAKFVGSYALIAGGTESYAMIALTGMPMVYSFVRDSQYLLGATPLGWQWCSCQYVGRSDVAMSYTHIRGDMPSLNDDQIWSRLQLYHQRNYMMTACIHQFERPPTYKGFFRRDGLVLGHAYTLLAFKTARVPAESEEAEIVEWIDQDGDQVGFERVGQCLYAVVNGSRWQPSGVQDTVHIAELHISQTKPEYKARDTMGTVFVGILPADKQEEVARMWAASKQAPKAQKPEPNELKEGVRVRFHGLKSNPELNGRLGEVIRMSEQETAASPAKYVVKLIIDIGHYDVGTLADKYDYWEAVAKRSNLEVVAGVPGSRGGAVRLVLLRNPHGEGSLVTHEDGSTTHCTKWRGDWCDNSSLWDRHPSVAAQVKYTPGNDGRFWMSWEDFRRTFDKVCVTTKSLAAPSSTELFELADEFRTEEALPISLHRMASMEEAEASREGRAPFLRKEFQKACIKFDPYDQIPGFLGSDVDTRLKWEASKPGRLHQFLQIVKPEQVGSVTRRVHELGLGPALGPQGQHVA